MTKRILVTGATGLLGKRLVATLLRDGHEVVATSRNRESASQMLGSSVHCVEWDYRTQPFPDEAVDGVNAVYHLMGENIGAGRWTAGKKEKLRGSRILSTQKIVAALPESVTDFLCASAIGVYPGERDVPFDEDSLLPPADSFMTHLCQDWERAAASAERPTRRRASLRIGLVLAERGMLEPLIPLYRLGLGGPIGSGRQKLPWIHIDDLVGMLRFVLEHRELEGPVNLVGPGPVTLSEFSRELARTLGRPHFLRVPALAVRLALGEASALILSTYDVRAKKMTEAGFSFRFDSLASALEDVITNLDARG